MLYSLANLASCVMLYIKVQSITVQLKFFTEIKVQQNVSQPLRRQRKTMINTTANQCWYELSIREAP